MKVYEQKRFLKLCSAASDAFHYALSHLIGPVLFTVCLLIYLVQFSIYYGIIIPMYEEYYSDEQYAHLSYQLYLHHAVSIFLWINILFNYYKCYITKNSSGPAHDQLMQQLEAIADITIPKSSQEIDEFKQKIDDFVKERKEVADEKEQELKQKLEQRSSVLRMVFNYLMWADKATGKPQWVFLEPFQWGYCKKTNKPKPPRFHYDKASKAQVLCFDHYCPWMFNSVGYFNYRYFVTYLFYAVLGNAYGAYVTYEPCLLGDTDLYLEQMKYNILGRIQDPVNYEPQRVYYLVPHPDESGPLLIGYRLCATASFIVGLFFLFHLYLVLTNQTTIEFQANYHTRIKTFVSSKGKEYWKNPYDLGWKQNWQQVYGTQNIFRALLLPSAREPEFFRIPFEGSDNKGKRPTAISNETEKKDE